MSADVRVNVARWIPRSRANGPGERFVLWVQGCPLACQGCWNPDTWSSEPRLVMRVEELLGVVRDTSNIEGVTLTGGEPFAQATALLPFVEAVKALGLSVMIFTGYEMEELRSPAALELLCVADVLVTGRFIAAQRSIDLAWRGSANQEIHFLSERYGPANLSAEVEAEIHLNPDGTACVTGFPQRSLLAVLAGR